MDKYQRLRDATAAFPYGYETVFGELRGHEENSGAFQIGATSEEGVFFSMIEVNNDHDAEDEDARLVANYIAAADPDTIASLLAENKEFRDALEFVASAYDMFASVGDNSLAFYEAYSVARAALNRANTGDQQ